MNWTISYLKEHDVLWLKTRGVLKEASANQMVEALVEAAKTYHCAKHLVDHRSALLEMNMMGFYKRPSVNERIGISRLWKTAIVWKRQTDDTHFMETVFRNRGFNLRAFDDFEKAMSWLIET